MDYMDGGNPAVHFGFPSRCSVGSRVHVDRSPEIEMFRFGWQARTTCTLNKLQPYEQTL